MIPGNEDYTGLIQKVRNVNTEGTHLKRLCKDYGINTNPIILMI